MLQQSGAANTAQIQALQRELTEKNAMLDRLQTGAGQYASEKESLLEDLIALTKWKDSALVSINALSNEVALNAASQMQQGGTGKIDDVIAKLSDIRDEIRRRDDQLVHTKSATEALLRKGQQEQQRRGPTGYAPYGRKWSPGNGNAVGSRSAPPPAAATVAGAGAGAFLARKPAAPSVNVIGSGFSTRQRNVAAVRTSNFASSPISAAPAPPVVASSPAEPQSSNTTPAGTQTKAKPKTQPSNTMSAYEAALMAMRNQKAGSPAAGEGERDEGRGSIGP
mmetsp:Transcript_16967/g.36676  ORF Transcript_16967/g.36676 Transcript_16967/m.36676 type:complete len:280 (+) Transcript_16967:3-842(+)